MAYKDNIKIKKQFGQHFLRDHTVTHTMINAVELDNKSSVLEIGCGDGFLTRDILQEAIARLWIFEIDPEWATYVTTHVQDDRLHMMQEDVLSADFSRLQPHTPWVLLANLPYQVTFPILHKLQQHRHMFTEGVVMVQEEVAQKITKTSGRGYGYVSLFFQHYFEWQLLTKIPPTAFYPPPKVTSRLLYFKPRTQLLMIPDEENFWRFIKQCFLQPRRMLKNNLFAYPQETIAGVPEHMLNLRAQQLSMADFLMLWDIVRG